jgi:type VI secretion system secreted protein VgrG
MALKQENRMLGLATPLGDDALVLTGFRGREEMSRLFRYELSMLSDNGAIAAKDIVGKNVSFCVKLEDGEPRWFNGYVSRFAAGDESEDGRRSYRAEVVPWLWFLTLKSDCRIFQNQDVKQITEQVLKDLNFTDFDTKQIKGHHPKRVYCVQYNENTFQFLSRLWEEEGVFFYFKHENGKHQLVLADDKQAYFDCPQQEVDYPRRFGPKREADVITAWEHRWEFRTGKVAHTDYNFETPNRSLLVDEKTVLDVPGMDKFEQFEFPGVFGVTDDGRPLAKIRMEQQEAGFDVVEAESHCRTFSPGGKFKIGKHRSSAEQGKSFVITGIEHFASEPGSYESGVPAGDGYRNEFRCIPDSVTYRPERVSRKPVIHSVQTAVVVGPKDQEIYTDEHGRVKVHFHWDRWGQKNEESSCWIRVSQTHAGQGFGAMSIPRVGEEVVVSFCHGDPDQPLVIGRVYHAENKPPFALPGDMNVSGMKSNSTPGGGGFNEISMNDTKDKELLNVHAQKDLNATIQNNETRTVVGGTQTVTVKGDTSLTVQDGNRTVNVGSASYKCSAKQAIELHGQSEGITAVGDAKGVKIKGTGEGVSILGEPEFHAHGKSKASLTSPDVFIGDKHVLIGGTEIEVVGKKITLSAGGGSITIDEAGITIDGKLLKAVASGEHVIRGGLVKIN